MRFRVQYKNGTQVIVKPEKPEEFVEVMVKYIEAGKPYFCDKLCLVATVDVCSIGVYEPA